MCKCHRRSNTGSPTRWVELSVPAMVQNPICLIWSSYRGFFFPPESTTLAEPLYSRMEARWCKNNRIAQIKADDSVLRHMRDQKLPRSWWRYRHCIEDLPYAGHRITLDIDIDIDIEVRRFRCDNLLFPRQTFSERVCPQRLCGISGARQGRRQCFGT